MECEKNTENAGRTLMRVSETGGGYVTEVPDDDPSMVSQALAASMAGEGSDELLKIVATALALHMATFRKKDAAHIWRDLERLSDVIRTNREIK